MRVVDFANVDLNLLKLFDALLKERSVTRAGQRLGLSQPAASRGLGRLRKLMADPLMVRTSQGLELTPRAIELAEPVAKLLDDARSIVAPSVFDASTASGSLTIATTDHMTLLMMPTLLSSLEQLAPGLDLIIPAQSSDNVAAVSRGDADMAIGVFYELPDRLHRRALYDEDLVCLVRRNHPVTMEGLNLDSFISLKHISVIITGHGGSTVDDALADHGLTRRIAVRLPHFLAAPMLVAKSDMILCLPRRLARQMYQSVAIEILELPLEVEPFTPSVIWHARHNSDPAHTWLRQLIVGIGSTLGSQ